MREILLVKANDKALCRYREFCMKKWFLERKKKVKKIILLQVFGWHYNLSENKPKFHLLKMQDEICEGKKI